MKLYQRIAGLLAWTCLVSPSIHAQEVCNWKKGSVRFYPHLLEVVNKDNQIMVMNWKNGVAQYKNPSLELAFEKDNSETSSLPKGVTQNYIRWQADWDGSTSAVDYSDEVTRLGNDFSVELFLKPTQFTLENNYTLWLKPRAFLGSSENQACAKDRVLVVLRTGDARDGLIRYAFVSTTDHKENARTPPDNSSEPPVRLWAMVGQSVANSQIGRDSQIWVGLKPSLKLQSSQADAP